MEDPNQLGITIAIAIVIIAGATAVTLSFLFGVGAIWVIIIGAMDQSAMKIEHRIE